MTKKKQGMDEDALGGLFDSIDLVYEDDLPEAQAEESQAQATDAAPAVPVAVAEEVAEGTNEAPSEEASGETPDETSEEEAEAAEDAEASDETDEASGEVAPGSGFDPVSAAMTGDEEEEGQLTLARYASRAYLEYAMSVVKSRALPDVSDGQKPVQRRILIDMYKMGLSAGKKPVKSARVVGDVLGKYHPHGDQSVYDALVRMAQNFSLRYPLIDGKGNFGSRDGDSQAAMRYTEARLMPIAELLLDEVESGAVDFVPNYDGNFREPVELPAKLPFVLLNGSSGIAVGMATSIPSHNLRETAEAVKLLLEKPEATLEEVLEKLPGPDFPCGGQIISSPDVIRDTYRTGRGKITVRARYHFEEMARGQWQLVFDELPPEASSASVLSEIDDITNPKVPKGKKSLSPKQIQAKTALLALLDRARDESGRDVPVRLVFEPRTSRVNREEFVSALLSQTKLESNVSVNLVMLGIDGKPRQKGLMEILGEWVSFRLNAVRRRSQARLDDVNDRLHVLEGRRLILLNIDRVIEIIRHADEPKKALMEAFPLSDRQAEDILEMRLRQIAKLAAIAIEKEIDELETERRKLERLLGSEALLRRQVAREVDDAVKKFGDDRRTLIEEARVAQNEATVPSSPVTVIITEKGFLTTRSGHDYDLSALNLRVGDAVLKTIECRTTDSICALSQTGRSYTIAVSALPGGRSDGQPLSAFIDLEKGGEIVAWAAADEKSRVLLYADNGLGLVCRTSDLVARPRAGKAFFKPEDGSVLLGMVALDEANPLLACLASKNRLLVFDASEVRLLSAGGKGVMLMGLDEDAKLLTVTAVNDRGLLVRGTGRGGKAREQLLGRRAIGDYIAKRARKGKTLPLTWKAEAVEAVAGDPEPEAPIEGGLKIEICDDPEPKLF